MKISQLAQATTVNDEDVFPVVQDGETKKVTAKALLENQPTNIILDEENNVQLMAGEKPVGNGVPIPLIDATYKPKSTNAQSGVAVAEATKEVTNFTKDTFANVLKGSASGKAISVDDVSPIKHAIDLKVKSKNIIAPFTDNKEVIRDGVTMSVEQGGQTITLNGTCGTSGGGRAVFHSVATPFVLEKGKTYTLSVQIISGTTDGTYYVYISNYNNQVSIRACTTKITFTAEDTVEAFIGVNLVANSFYDNVVISFQLEESTEATDYEEYVDPSTVTLTRCGKNIVNLSSFNVGEQLYMDGGTGVAFGKMKNTICALSEKIFVLSNTKYTFTLDNTKYWLNRIVEFDKNGLSTNQFAFYTSESMDYAEYTFTTQSTTAYIYCQVKNKNREEVTMEDLQGINFQIEVGNVATDYEEFIDGGTYTPNADGTVIGLYSMSPNMTIYADKTGVTMKCEYNKDTNKVIESLVNAIISLGGDV